MLQKIRKLFSKKEKEMKRVRKIFKEIAELDDPFDSGADMYPAMQQSPQQAHLANHAVHSAVARTHNSKMSRILTAEICPQPQPMDHLLYLIT